MKIAFRIFSYVRPYWRRVIVLYVALFAALGIQLAVPLVLANAIDDGIVARNASLLVRAALLIVGLTLLQGLFTFVRAYVAQALAEQVAFDLRNELYAHLQRLPFAFYDRAQTGQLMSRATEDINNIRSMLVLSMRALVLAIGTLLAVTVILFRIDARLAALALAPLPFLIWYSVRFGIAIRPMFLKVQQQFGVMTTALQENVSGFRVVRAFAQEQAESARFESELEELFARNLRAAQRWSFAYPMTLLMSGLGLAAVLWFGGYQVVSGALSIGTLVAFSRYLTLLNEPVRWLGFVVNRIAKAIASGERIFETLDTRPTVTERPGAIALQQPHGEVRFEEVSFTFPGARRPALEEVSFTARPGTVTALVGPTGSGKSAIINLIPRFYDPSAGRVLVDGHDVRELTLDSLRGQIAIVHQETFLFSVSIRDNIAYGREEATHEEVVAAATAARAHDFIDAMPEGYATEVGERGVTLSGGQKQRIAIARALLLDPPILILDDATSSVDTETEQEIQQALRALMAGRTSFVIAQRVSTVQDADQILVLQQGRIVARGTHDELRRHDGFYREMHELQRREEATAGDGLSASGERRGARLVSDTIDPDDLLGKAYDPRIARRLFAFALPYRRRALSTLLLILVATASDLLLPKLFSLAVDEVTQARRLSVLNLLGVAFLVTLGVRFLTSWGEFYHISWLGNRIVFDIRNQMFRHLQTLNVGYVDRRGVGAIMSRIQNDVGVINEFFSDAVAGIVGSATILVGIVVLMLWTNWQLALLSFAVLPVMVLFMRYWREQAIATYRATRRTIAIVNANLAESIAGVRVAQAFTREPANIRHFERISRDNLDASIDAAWLSSLLFPIVSLIGAIATATTVYVGGQLALGQTLTIGELVLFIALIDRFFEPIRDLSQQYNVLQAAMVAGERIFEVLDVEPEVKDKPGAQALPPIDGRIDYTDVRFGYGETEILHDIDLHIAAGETVALVGETGAGKSSMVNLLLRFADVWAGSITIDGHDVRDVTQNSLRSQLGVVLQDTFLFGGTVRDNIAFARPEASLAEVEWAAREVGAHDFITALNEGYETEIQERGVSLSVGQRQLLSFARALLADPRILILDEATSSVDTQTERVIQEALRRLLRGRTSIVIAHRLSTIREADVIVVMDAGRIVEQGTHEELMEKGGRYFALATARGGVDAA